MKLREVLEIIQKLPIEILEKECYCSEIDHFDENYYLRDNIIIDVKLSDDNNIIFVTDTKNEIYRELDRYDEIVVQKEEERFSEIDEFFNQ